MTDKQHARTGVQGTPEGDWVSMAVRSERDAVKDLGLI